MSPARAASAGALPEGLVEAIDRGGELPIGVQLAWALRGCIRDGRVGPAERLPGLRDMAEAVGVNANTVRAVYQRLEREGLIESRQGSGTFVAERPAGAGATSSTVTTIAADAAREAQAAGADPREVAAALYVAPSGAVGRGGDAAASGRADAGANVDAAVGAGVGAAPDAPAHRRALRAQIATLERAIGAMEAEHPGVAPPPDQATRRRGGPTLLSAEELEQVRSDLVRRLASVQTAIDELGRMNAAETNTTARSTDEKAVSPRDVSPIPAGTRSRSARNSNRKSHATGRPATAT